MCCLMHFGFILALKGCSCVCAHFTATGVVRLAGGPNNYSGRVELFKNGRWQIVCDRKWNKSKGRVVCRQVGFSDITWARTHNHYGPESQVSTDQLECSGKEDTLADCNLIQSMGIGTSGMCKKALVQCVGKDIYCLFYSLAN